jgi:hypothetical protein
MAMNYRLRRWVNASRHAKRIGRNWAHRGAPGIPDAPIGTMTAVHRLSFDATLPLQPVDLMLMKIYLYASTVSEWCRIPAQ